MCLFWFYSVFSLHNTLRPRLLNLELNHKIISDLPIKSIHNHLSNPCVSIKSTNKSNFVFKLCFIFRHNKRGRSIKPCLISKCLWYRNPLLERCSLYCTNLDLMHALTTILTMLNFFRFTCMHMQM